MATKKVKKDIITPEYTNMEGTPVTGDKPACSIGEIDTSVELISERTVKLDISSGMVINAPEGTTKIEVTNMGAGDLYVDDKSFSYSKDVMITVGVTTSIPDVNTVYLISNSRPTATIKFYR